jgi:hypothetical protein
MRLNSLAVRLIVAATLWSAVALLAAGFILTSLYRQSVERSFDQRLTVYLRTLVGMLAAQSPSNLSDPGNLGEQRFELPYSGWYWQVRRRKSGPVVLASKSLFNDVIDFSKAINRHDIEDATGGALLGPDNQSLRALDRTIDFGPGNTYEVLVTGNAGDMADEIAAFTRSTLLTLSVFGVGLVISITAQTRWGLRPLDRVRRGLSDLRTGKAARFTGSYPAEIAPLAKELNALLESNQQIIERARTQVGNLAQRHHQRGAFGQGCTRRESDRAGRDHAAADGSLSRPRPDCGALEGDRRRHRGRARGRPADPGDEPHPRRPAPPAGL